MQYILLPFGAFGAGIGVFLLLLVRFGTRIPPLVFLPPALTLAAAGMPLATGYFRQLDAWGVALAIFAGIAHVPVAVVVLRSLRRERLAPGGGG